MRLNWKSGMLRGRGPYGGQSLAWPASARLPTPADRLLPRTARSRRRRRGTATGPSSVAANEREVLAFLREVLNEHHGESAGAFTLTQNVQWHGGTVGTITGRVNVAGLFARRG